MVTCKQGRIDERNIPTSKSAVNDYKAMKNALVRGWNTFDVNSISTHVLLPE